MQKLQPDSSQDNSNIDEKSVVMEDLPWEASHTNPRSNAQFSNYESAEGRQIKVIHRLADSY
ncbi:MAG: hypothetical protein NVSMB27_43400 [Ktedonobacteraceae bacterium]